MMFSVSFSLLHFLRRIYFRLKYDPPHSKDCGKGTTRLEGKAVRSSQGPSKVAFGEANGGCEGRGQVRRGHLAVTCARVGRQ